MTLNKSTTNCTRGSKLPHQYPVTSSLSSSSYFILQRNIKQIRVITTEYKNMPKGCQRSKRSLNWPPILLYNWLVQSFNLYFKLHNFVHWFITTSKTMRHAYCWFVIIVNTAQLVSLSLRIGLHAKQRFFRISEWLFLRFAAI